MTIVARYGLHGPRIKLKKMIRLQDGRLDWKNWTRLPHCPYDCGKVITPWDKGGALGAAYGGRTRAPADRLVQRRPIGFTHPKDPTCPASRANDPSYAHHTQYAPNPRGRQLVKAALMSPRVREGNRKVLAHLMFHLTGREMTQDDRERLGKAAKRKYNLAILRFKPWLLPYILMQEERVHMRNIDGVTKKVLYDGVGTQSFDYLDRRREKDTNRDVRHQKVYNISKQLQLSELRPNYDLEPLRDLSTQKLFVVEVSAKAWKAIVNSGTKPRPRPSPRQPQQRLDLRRRPLAKTA